MYVTGQQTAEVANFRRISHKKTVLDTNSKVWKETLGKGMTHATLPLSKVYS